MIQIHFDNLRNEIREFTQVPRRQRQVRIFTYTPEN